MTTRAEEIAAPYTVEVWLKREQQYRWTGPTGHGRWTTEKEADEQAGNLNAAYKQVQQDAQPSPTEDLEGRAQRFFMAWPNGDIPAMLAAFARSLAQPSAPTVEKIMEVVKRVRPITDDCPKCDGMGCSGPCPPRYWEQPMRDELTKLLTNK